MPTREYPEHVILDGIVGQGHYVGTFLTWEQLSNGWWGEGEVKFYKLGTQGIPPSAAPARRTISVALGALAESPTI